MCLSYGLNLNLKHVDKESCRIRDAHICCECRRIGDNKFVIKLTSNCSNPVSILYKSTAGRSRPVSYPDGPITARYRFIKNTSWEGCASGALSYSYVRSSSNKSSFYSLYIIHPLSRAFRRRHFVIVTFPRYPQVTRNRWLVYHG